MELAKGKTYRTMEQNRESDIDPYKYVQLIFDKGAKNLMEKWQFFQQIVLEQLDIHI